MAFGHGPTRMARPNIDDQSRQRHLQQKQVGSHMPIPSRFFGVTAKQLLVLLTVGCAAAYLLSNHDEPLPESLALETFIRSQEQVSEQVGAVLGIALALMVRMSLASEQHTVIGDQRAPVAAVLVFDSSPRMQYVWQNETRLDLERRTSCVSTDSRSFGQIRVEQSLPEDSFTYIPKSVLLIF